LKNKFSIRVGLFAKLYLTLAIATILLIWLVTLVSDFTEAKQSMIAQEHRDTLRGYAQQASDYIKNNEIQALKKWAEELRGKENTLVAILKTTPHWLVGQVEKEMFDGVVDLTIGRHLDYPIHLYFNYNPVMKIPVPDSQYNLMIQLPQRMRPGVYWQLLNTGIRLGFPILLIALICLVIYRNIISPLRVMQRATQQMTLGDFDIRLEHYLGHRGDEFSDLAKSFDKMAERISLLIQRQKQLIQDISHELRTPITRIKLVLNDSEENPAFKRVEQEVNGMQSLLEDTLTLSWLTNQESNNYRGLQVEEVDLSALIEAIADDAGFEFPNHELVLLIPNSYVIKNSNHRAIGQTIENIIRNAMKYSDEGMQVEVELVDTNLDDDISRVSIIISDQGRGIESQYLEEIFEPFFRIDSTRTKTSTHIKNKPEGYGLGLALSKRQIESVGGSLHAEHNLPCGLRFVIILPVA
jgi:two-component system, OmpR family, sensor histidine kinase PfeS